VACVVRWASALDENVEVRQCGAMPTVLRTDGYRLFFYSLDNAEPPHVHIEHGDRTAKYWLDPVVLARSDGFRSHELGKLRTLVTTHRAVLQEAWRVHFSHTV
jgi:hypothetical protein